MTATLVNSTVAAKTLTCGHLQIPPTRPEYAGRRRIYIYEGVPGGLNVAFFDPVHGVLVGIQFVDPQEILR
jgi:hypothetical protein